MSSRELVTIREALLALGLPHKTSDVRKIRQKLKRRGVTPDEAGNWLISVDELLVLFPNFAQKRRAEKAVEANARNQRRALTQLTSALSAIDELQRENANLLQRLNAVTNRVFQLEQRR